MTDAERLFELTEPYLKSLVSGIANSVSADFDSSAAFSELGVDSFRVLKIIKALEGDFGRLPKTLLFENFNINDLAHYFVRQHAPTLAAKFAKQFASSATAAHSAVSVGAAAMLPGTPSGRRLSAPNAAHAAKPILLLEKEAYAHPELGELVCKTFAEHKNDGSVSRGTRNIAPNLFIGSERKGFFNYARSKNIILAYAYTGPRDYFAVLAEQMCQYCVSRDFELSILTADEISAIGKTAFSSTPFGALQRILDLQSFTLSGNAMRRLRYQVSKFEKAGSCRTEEYRCGSNPELAQRIAGVIDEWCAARTMVNPLIYIVKEEILAGRLNQEHRIFTTYLDAVLQNVILISPLAAEHNGYLMDLEFYAKGMPLGGLEFAIVKIIEALVAEGCNLLSLGGTYGCKLQESANADAAVDKILDDLRMQNIFNDEGNLQFKNKFRPENRAIFLCQPTGRCTPDNVIDIIMMIADPAKMQTPDTENHTWSKPTSGEICEPALPAAVTLAASAAAVVIEGNARSGILADYGFNPLNIPHAHVEFDLQTDSWAQLQMPAIERRSRHLYAQLQQPIDIDKNLQAVFPFAHFVLTASGRTAESIFYRAWPKKGIVLQNLLFPTAIFHQIDQGFTPRELPHPQVFRLDSKELYKGELDWPALQAQIEADQQSISLVCIELSDNAAGGQPVSMQHLRRVKELLAGKCIALVMDATRILENAQFLIENDGALAGRTIWEVVRDIVSHADAVIVSLAKDFCVKGGLIATNDGKLFHTLQDLAREEGCGLDAIDRKFVGLSLQNRTYFESQTQRRMGATRRLWRALKEQGVPVVEPVGGHCVLIDVKQIAELKGFRHPVASFVAWLYLGTGIRAGAHNAGMQRNTSINDLVRLAIPIGLKHEQVDDIIGRLIAFFASRRSIPEITLAGGSKDSAHRDIHSEYRLIRYHNLSGLLTAKSPISVEVPASEPKPRLQAGRTLKALTGGVAIVGMAGRYPKAKNLDEMWDNLLHGADCTESIPGARMELRTRDGFTRKYRGGFIDAVDKFDAQFFGIPLQEAAELDPQERLFLEVACEAIEDAGYYPETLGGDDSSRNVGVFVGAVWSMYQLLGTDARIKGDGFSSKSFFSSIANRVSDWMNLSGPSLTLDTACSASLTAINLACEAIHSGECSAAIVGGVSLDLHQSRFGIRSTGSSLVQDAVCRSFGEGVDAQVPGEGVGALFLKPLDRAIADGDNIHGVIKSSVVAHSGKTEGCTTASPHPQAKLVWKALERANVDARSIGYVETHGTGIDLFDSAEIAGLTTAFGKYAVPKQSCAIGSIKTNLGHLAAATGVAAVHKILLQMKHRKLVPSLHPVQARGGVDLTGSPFFIQQAVDEWKPKEVDGAWLPRRAAISAIGASGTNVHIVLEEYESASRSEGQEETEPKERIFPMSAKTAAQLGKVAIRLRDFLQSANRVAESDLAHTLQLGRKSFDHRVAVIARTNGELIEKLTCYIEEKKHDDVMPGHVGNAEAITGFLGTNQKREFVELLIQSRDPRRLARLWSDGVIPDWQGLDIGQTGRKVSLPTYPFADERHWISSMSSLQPAGSDSSGRLDVHSFMPIEVKPLFAVAEDLLTAASTLAVTAPPPTEEDAMVPDERPGLSTEDKARLFVRQMFNNRPGASGDDIDDDSHLMDTGITSMDMAEMTQSMKQEIDPAFSPIAFFECTTVRALYQLLAREYASVFQAMAMKDPTIEDTAIVKPTASIESAELVPDIPRKPLHVQDAEAALPLLDLEESRRSQPGSAHTAFLTGATGFLGIHVLSELLNSNSGAHAYCLVRSQSKEHGLQRILQQAERLQLSVDATRVVVVCGDITEPRLGLSEQDWDLCCRQTQQILHASAHVNHIEGYATFRDSTQGMKEIIRLASSHEVKLIQFISSIAGCVRKVGEEFTIFEKEDFVADGEHVYGGYGQSKWVQETLLKRARDIGIPYVIYRFGELSGSSRTGLGQTDDMLHRLLQMRLAVGCREKISSDVLDMLPVDFAAKLIVNTGKTPELWNAIVHATHLKPYSLANLYRKAQHNGLQFKPVTRAQYLAECYEFVRFIYSMNPVNGFVLECVLRDAEGSSRNRKMMDGYFSVIFPFDQHNFKRSLQTLGLALPEWNSLIDRYFKRWSEDDCGFMARVFDYQMWSQLDEARKTALTSKKITAIKGPAVEKSKGKPLSGQTAQDIVLLENVREA